MTPYYPASTEPLRRINRSRIGSKPRAGIFHIPVLERLAERLRSLGAPIDDRLRLAGANVVRQPPSKAEKPFLRKRQAVVQRNHVRDLLLHQHLHISRRSSYVRYQ